MSDVEHDKLGAEEAEEFTFDSSLKKKKKKKKLVTEEELIEHISEEPASQQQQKADDEDPVKPEENGEKTGGPSAVEDDDAVMFGEKKKKKKKKVVDFADEVKVDDDTIPAEAPAEAPEGTDLGIKKKKKKRPDLADFEKQLMEDGEDGERAEDDVFAAEGQEEEREAKRFKETWLGTDRDYNYQELLGRVFDILRQNNPELAGEKRRYTIVPPSVHREGNKKTIFANVADICKRMHRQPEHVIQYLFAELGTSGSIDGAQRLIIKGRFQQKQIENVLRRYIVEYVTCKTCKSPDTLLTKENRIYFQQCESCGSTRSVSAIKTGFKAQTEKRAVLRRAAAQ